MLNYIIHISIYYENLNDVLSKTNVLSTEVEKGPTEITRMFSLCRDYHEIVMVTRPDITGKQVSS